MPGNELHSGATRSNDPVPACKMLVGQQGDKEICHHNARYEGTERSVQDVKKSTEEELQTQRGWVAGQGPEQAFQKHLSLWE